MYIFLKRNSFIFNYKNHLIYSLPSAVLVLTQACQILYYVYLEKMTLLGLHFIAEFRPCLLIMHNCFFNLSLAFWIARPSRLVLIGNLVPSKITAISLTLANSKARFLEGKHFQLLNLFAISAGHPGAGISPAIEPILFVLREIECTGISKDTLVTLVCSTTSSGLVKVLSKLCRKSHCLSGIV